MLKTTMRATLAAGALSVAGIGTASAQDLVLGMPNWPSGVMRLSIHQCTMSVVRASASRCARAHSGACSGPGIVTLISRL